MSEIVTSSTRVCELISDIAIASSEQRVGIEQINEAIVQLELVTQQNATLSERAAADSGNLAVQAGALVEAVARFSVGNLVPGNQHQDNTTAPPQPVAGRKQLSLSAD